MKNGLVWRLILGSAALLSVTPPASADVVFALLPSDGSVFGPPGSLVGWGYSLTNTDASNWFVPTDLNSGSFSNGTPILLFDFPILPPGGSVTEPFDSVKSVGVFELQWGPSAPVGFVDSGLFVLSGEWWNGDPFNGGSFIAAATDSTLAYTATVSGAGDVPEPRSLLLLAGGIAAILGRRPGKHRSAPLGPVEHERRQEPSAG